MSTARESATGRLPFEYEAATSNNVTAWGGLPMVVEMMTALGLDSFARTLELHERSATFDEVQLLRAFVLLMVSGGDCLDDIKALRGDEALAKMLGHGLPSAD